MCIVGGKRFILRSVHSCLTGSSERKCNGLSGEGIEVNSRNGMFDDSFNEVWLSKFDLCMCL